MPDRRSALKLALMMGVGGAVPAIASARRYRGDDVAANLVLGKALLEQGDTGFRDAAAKLAASADGKLGQLAEQRAWRDAVRNDFAAGRVICTTGCAFAETEALLLAALAISAGVLPK